MRTPEQREKHLAYMKKYNAKTRPTKKSLNIPHANIGRIQSQEEKDKRAESLRGLKRTEETKKRMREGENLGRFTSEKLKGNKHRLGLSPPNKGIAMPDATKLKVSISKIGCASWNKGIKGSVKPNSGSFKKGQFAKEKNPNWAGGITHLPYAKTWTPKLRESIRLRDDNTCQICGSKNRSKKHDIHHINYIKEDCSVGNLITLCRNCHSATNHRRDYWLSYFTNSTAITGLLN